MTHNELILQHLSTGAALTQLEALQMIGTSRLAARISEIEAQGYVITHTPRIVAVRNGKTARVMSYKLEVAA